MSSPSRYNEEGLVLYCYCLVPYGSSVAAHLPLPPLSMMGSLNLNIEHMMMVMVMVTMTMIHHPNPLTLSLSIVVCFQGQ